MRGFFASLIALIAALVMLLLPLGSGAQTFDQVFCNAHYDVGYGNMVVSVNVLEGIYPGPPATTTVQGTISIASNSWRASGNVFAVALSMQYSFGAFVPHAELISKTTSLTYFVSPYGSKPVHLVVSLTQLGLYGQGGFQIISDDAVAGDAGRVVAESQWNGEYAEYPFASGALSITE